MALAEAFEGGTAGTAITTANTGLTAIDFGDARFVASPVHGGSLAACADTDLADLLRYSEAPSVTGGVLTGWFYLNDITASSLSGSDGLMYADSSSGEIAKFTYDHAVGQMHFSYQNGSGWSTPEYFIAPENTWINLGITVTETEVSASAQSTSVLFTRTPVTYDPSLQGQAIGGTWAVSEASFDGWQIVLDDISWTTAPTVLPSIAGSVDTVRRAFVSRRR
jgi:hypothetical protein